ncbi:MAG: hypothetical protein P4N59_08200, partial [Negativicutes bacterium]|nr:hypothetical protein [Negativicutes bacterium]
SVVLGRNSAAAVPSQPKPMAAGTRLRLRQGAKSGYVTGLGQEGEEGQDFFQKCQKHWEIEGFLHERTNEPAKPRGSMERGLKPELQLFANYVNN